MRIIVSGGLGNQMFQYALYLALKDRGVNVKLDTSLYSYVEMHNGYELERCFGLHDEVVCGGKFYLFMLRVIMKIKPSKIFHRDFFSYDSTIFSSKYIFLHGSWQSEKYFKQIEDVIRKSFIFTDIDKINLSISEEIRSYNSVSLHIRRGDYLGNSIYGGVCTEEYYSKAIDELLTDCSLTDNIKFYIFSDDKIFANQFIQKINYPTELIEHNKSIDSYKDMFLMSQCRHNIIANSSFSWWGAWLNSNPDKIVIAPNQWFGKESLLGAKNNFKDIVPNSWIRI